MNLYAALSDNSYGYDTFAVLVFAESRGKARYAMWRQFSDMYDRIDETSYVIRLVDKGRDDKPHIIFDDDDATHELWTLAKERTGIYQRKEDDDG